MLSKLTNLAIPPWARIAVPVALVLAIFASGMWLQRKLDAAQVARLEGRIQVLEYAVADRDTTIAGMKNAAKAAAKTMADNQAAMLAAQTELEAALARPPEVVVRWRERAADTSDVITSDRPCAEQVGEAFTAMQQALRERRHP